MLRAREFTKQTKTKVITRVEMKLTKTGSFEHKNRKQNIWLQVKFAMYRKFSSIAKIHYVANFPACSEIALFINVGYCSIAPCCYYSRCTIPFLLALIFFIPGLLKLIENHMKLIEINPTSL